LEEGRVAVEQQIDALARGVGGPGAGGPRVEQASEPSEHLGTMIGRLHLRHPSGQLRWPGVTLYELVGGDAWFEALVQRFYAGVEDDVVLRPLYPDDLVDARAHLTGFLIQYWGGP